MGRAPDQASFRGFDPLDFLAAVIAHIPDAHEKTALFYGWYSNPTRGYRKRHGLVGEARGMEPASTGEARAPPEVRRPWARLIRQVYDVDPLVFAWCGGTRRIIAVTERPAVIRQILDQLGLPSVIPSLRAPPDTSDGLASDDLLGNSRRCQRRIRWGVWSAGSGGVLEDDLEDQVVGRPPGR